MLVVVTVRLTSRGPYSRISHTDKSRIVRAADGGNWRQLAEHLGVNYQTAYTWIREDCDKPKQKGGRKRKFTDEHIDALVAMVEQDLTLKGVLLCRRTLTEFRVHVSASTIHNYLQGPKKDTCYACYYEHGRQQRTTKTLSLTGQSVHERWEDLFLFTRQMLTCFAYEANEKHVLLSKQLLSCRPLRDQTFM